MATELATVDQSADGSTQAMVEVASSRQAQEVQALAVMAKRFPRDETSAVTRIVNGCKRLKLAEGAMYSYPRGGQKITGPSIRLAEEMARCWGNLDFGIVELEQRWGESTMMAYCWDLETNTRQTKVFTVRHERHSRNGKIDLTDPRDIYETTANNGARRLRACILGVIPGDVQDLAVEQCVKTLAGNSSEPLIDRVRKMVAAFDGIAVSQDMLETRLGHKIDACNEQDLVSLRSIFQSLKDGMSTRDQWFEVATEAKAASSLDDVTDQLSGGATAKAKLKRSRAKTAKLAAAEDMAAEEPPPGEGVPIEDNNSQ